MADKEEAKQHVKGEKKPDQKKAQPHKAPGGMPKIRGRRIKQHG